MSQDSTSFPYSLIGKSHSLIYIEMVSYKNLHLRWFSALLVSGRWDSSQAAAGFLPGCLRNLRIVVGLLSHAGRRCNSEIFSSTP